jgi:hypothetical protein
MLFHVLVMAGMGLSGFGVGRVSHAKFGAELKKLEMSADADLKAAIAKVKAALHL